METWLRDTLVAFPMSLTVSVVLVPSLKVVTGVLSVLALLEVGGTVELPEVALGLPELWLPEPDEGAWGAGVGVGVGVGVGLGVGVGVGVGDGGGDDVDDILT